MKLPLSLTQLLGSSEFFLRKNAPTILTGAGVAGFIATIAMTIHAAPKAMDKLQAISIDVADVKGHIADGYTEKDRGKDLTKVYVQSTIEVAKVYGPTLLLGSASIICVISAHGMMLKRQASLVAAYSALSAGYEAYRKRVAEKVGEQEELELYRGLKYVQGCGDDGEPCEIIDFADSKPGIYSFFYDETSPNWKRTSEYNKFFLTSQQEYANQRLKAYGFLFMNEVLESLGLPRTQAGQIVGWKLNGPGDGYVDFGMFDVYDSAKRAFVNCTENVILLNFNVDGPISL